MLRNITPKRFPRILYLKWIFSKIRKTRIIIVGQKKCSKMFKKNNCKIQPVFYPDPCQSMSCSVYAEHRNGYKITFFQLYVNLSRVYFISTVVAYNTIRNIKSKRNVLVSFVFSSFASLVKKKKSDDQNKIKHTNNVVFMLRAPYGCSRVIFY